MQRNYRDGTYGNTYAETTVRRAPGNGDPFSQLCGSFCCSCAGIATFICGLLLLMYNEQSTVCVGRSLDVARDEHASIDCNNGGRDQSKPNALVHFSCPIAQDSLRLWTPSHFDNAAWLEGAFSTNAVKVRQDVEVYQCKEQAHTKTEKQGDRQIEKKSWTYSRAWDSSHIDSGRFKAWENQEARRALENGCGYDFQRNPQFPMASSERSADVLLTGAYDMSKHIGKIIADTPVQLQSKNYKPPFATGSHTNSGYSGHSDKRIADDGQAYTRGEFIDYYGQRVGIEKWEQSGTQDYSRGGSVVAGSSVYTCSPSSPELGCVRVTFKQSTASHVSFLGSLTAGGGANAWAAPASWMCSKRSASNKVELFVAKSSSVDELVDDALSTNAMMTWIYRLLGVIMSICGVRWFFEPIQTVANLVDQFFDWFKFIPLAGSLLDFLGDVVAGAVGIALWSVSVGIGLPCALTVWSITWCVMRPLVGIPMLLLCGGLLLYTFKAMSEYARVGKGLRQKTN